MKKDNIFHTIDQIKMFKDTVVSGALSFGHGGSFETLTTSPPPPPSLGTVHIISPENPILYPSTFMCIMRLMKSCMYIY